MMIIKALCILIGYVIGLFQTPFIIGKINGIDIRTLGSGNAGTTNVLRNMGAGWGALALLGDALKAILSAFIGSLLLTEAPILGALYGGLGAILGHIFPFFLKFKGGKGVACFFGLSIFLGYKYMLIFGLTFVLVVLITRYVSLGSILGVVFALFATIFFNEFLFGEISHSSYIEMIIVSIIITSIIVVRHSSNIKRILNGNENKISLKKRS